MKLPEQIPDELVELLKQRFNLEMREFYALAEVYEATAEYFNNLPAEWHPVSEKPDHDCDVWLFGNNRVFLGLYDTGDFYTDISGYAGVRPTSWTYANLPEPPKE